MARPRTEPRTRKFSIRFAPGELERLERESPAGELSAYLRKRALARAEHAQLLRGWAFALRKLASYANDGRVEHTTARLELMKEANALAAELEGKAGAL